MQDKIYTLLKDNIGSEVLKPSGIYNIFPKHIPDGAIDSIFPKAIIYNIIQGQVNLTSTLYTVQFTSFNTNYKECRRVAMLIKDLFNSKDFSNEAEGLLGTTVIDIIELEFDTETGYWGVAVNVTLKTTANW